MPIAVSNSEFTAEPTPSGRVGKSDRTRAELLTAAFNFLWSRPFREMTVSNLMQETPNSRSSFYNYFESPHGLMDSLLEVLEEEIMMGVNRWLTDDGDPVALVFEGLSSEVSICYRFGPFMKAVNDAAAGDARVESAWHAFLGRFDDAVCDRIAADQTLGLIGTFDPLPVATGLNQLNASTYIRTFGQRPRGRPGPVLDTLSRVWISTLYGQRWVASRSSTLIRE